MADSGRPQDQGRRHRARGAPSAATLTLLASYQAAMRLELERLLRELEGQPPVAGILPPAAGEAIAPKLPSLAERSKIWDLAIKVARELGTEVDVAPAGQGPTIAGSGGPTTTGRRAKLEV